MDVSFYHLLSSPLEKALPKLLEKIYGMGKRSVVVCDTEERLAEMNMILWTFSQSAFLPHGTAREGFAEDQPIWLTTQVENPNGASVLIITNHQIVSNFDGFERCLDFFNGQDQESLEKARTRWRHYKTNAFSLAYWQQMQDGSWEKQ